MLIENQFFFSSVVCFVHTFHARVVATCEKVRGGNGTAVVQIMMLFSLSLEYAKLPC